MAFIWKLFANFSQCNTFPYIFFIVLCENVCCLLNWPGFAQSTPLILLPNLFLSLKHMARATSRSQVDKSPTQCCDMLQKVSPFMLSLSSRLMLALPWGKSVMNISSLHKSFGVGGWMISFINKPMSMSSTIQSHNYGCWSLVADEGKTVPLWPIWDCCNSQTLCTLYAHGFVMLLS